ncbi:ankyrin repeat and SAM domain-containing protein 6-like [Panicum miliaceum]|uniref:Ankyrin repeat and SAM domain-containing protein 6-like n=1 Tax=Panicum miliaceum TaxID=4540 RepID=A0A3L6Q4Z9_PANMI|nr:ankyrin repeat and SAM domain-containing protein 6-like [Panicum miliaceum]
MAASSSSSSRHQVTITLGRSGQVVKRRAITDVINDDEAPLSGKKRSLRERLGSNVTDSDFYESRHRNKRQQTESDSSHGDDVSDRQVGKDDLRLKLMRKGLLQRSNGGTEQNAVDLREKLSRNQKNLSRYDARGHAPESRARYDMRDKPPELRSRYSSREGVLVSRPSAVVSRIPSARSVDEMDSSRKPYPSWPTDGLRHRSPERLTSFRGDASPPRAYDQIRSMPSLRSVGSSRPQSFITRDAHDTSRAQPYSGKSTISVAVQRANGITPSGAAMPTAPVVKEVPQTVTELLSSLGLEKYLVLFQAEEVDMAALRQMGESDLKDMGVPMGPRKKILLAVGPQSKQRQR